MQATFSLRIKGVLLFALLGFTLAALFGTLSVSPADASPEGFAAVQRTAGNYDKYRPQLQVVGNKIHYVWQEYDGSGYSQICTAAVNTDGTGWTAVKMTTGSYGKLYPQLQVINDKMYYVWQQYDGNGYQIWTGEMNTDGTGWVAVQRTTGPYDKYRPQLQVAGNRVHYVWQEQDGGNYYQICTLW